MRKNKMISKFCLSVAVLLKATLVFATNDPKLVLMKVYSVGVAEGADCANPIKLCDTPGLEVDFVQAPTLCNGIRVPPGRYNCVIIEMSDIVKYQVNNEAAASVAGCSASETYTLDVCREGSRTQNPVTLGYQNCGGVIGTPSEDRVFLYLHTGTNNPSSEMSFQKPTNSADTSKGLPLAEPWVVTSTREGKFYADFREKITSVGGSCGCNAPVFGFR